MLQLRLSRYEFLENEYGRTITFRIYDETPSALNCSSYTSAEVIITDVEGNEYIDQITPSWTTQTSGIGTFSFTDTKKLDYSGIFYVQVVLEKSGEESPTEPVKITVQKSGVKT
ncbi:receptor-binding protein [Nitrososphaeria virus YSH_1032793]|uniref:Receptor-binding protein n=1 Tax=Nitrososphaeria virus YSH_1032793 TaxID=3071320 RepID=A0A976YEV5_9CAUD|nr:receptor-binding protein [Yangshan Harbor Nitrososphaeria virus]UVF62245.1 receptor-binding protein [Nitrososphaeria virus YSH_1032793]